MSWQMHRIFCATAPDLEAERLAFYDAVAAFNETHAMPQNVLFVPVSITPNMIDKRFFQPVIDDNIRNCSYYVLISDGGWGAPERNFEQDFALAQACVTDPALPMREVATLGRPDTEEAYLRECDYMFTKWLRSLAR